MRKILRISTIKVIREIGLEIARPFSPIPHDSCVTQSSHEVADEVHR